MEMFTPLVMDSMDNLDMEMLILGNEGLKGMQLSKLSKFLRQSA